MLGGGGGRRRYGNVGRFINHACDGGNLTLQLVRVGGCPLPRVAFFAAESIAAGTELAFSYGEREPGEEKGQGHPARQRPCACQTSACSGLLPGEGV